MSKLLLTTSSPRPVLLAVALLAALPAPTAGARAARQAPDEVIGELLARARQAIELEHYHPVQIVLSQALAHAPERTDLLLTLAEAFHRDGRDERALALVQRAIEVEPSNATALAWRGRVLVALGHFNTAASSVRSLAEVDGRHPWIAPLRAHLALAEGDLDRCLAETAEPVAGAEANAFRLDTRGLCLLLGGSPGLEEFLETPAAENLRPAALLRTYGRHLPALGDLEAAIGGLPEELSRRVWVRKVRLAAADLTRDVPTRRAELEALIAAEPEVARWKVELARDAFEHREYEECVARLRRWFADTPMPYPAALMAGRALTALERCDEAVPMLEAYLETDAENPDGNAALADCHALEGRPDEAEAAYLRALAAAPLHRPAVTGLAGLLRKEGRDEEARALLAEFQRAQQEAQERQRPTRFVRLAQAAYSADRLDEAEENARKALELDPERIDAHAMIAVVAAERGDRAAARAALRKILEIDPENPRVRIELATLARADGDARRAAQLLEEQLDLHPGQVEGALRLTVLYRELGETGKALPRLDAALARNPASARLNGMRAEVLHDLEQYQEGLAAALRAAELEPDEAESWKRVAIIAERAGDAGALERARSELARLGR